MASHLLSNTYPFNQLTFSSNATSQCDLIHENGTVACERWNFDVDQGKTMVADYQLVCHNQYYRNLINTMFLIGEYLCSKYEIWCKLSNQQIDELNHAGVMIGNLFFGSIPDRIGRKFVTLFSHSILGLLAILIGISNNIYVYLLLRWHWMLILNHDMI